MRAVRCQNRAATLVIVPPPTDALRIVMMLDQTNAIQHHFRRHQEAPVVVRVPLLTLITEPVATFNEVMEAESDRTAVTCSNL